jgi:hypothetical protein
MRLSNEKALEGDTLCSVETQDEKTTGLLSYVANNPSGFVQTRRYLSKEDQEILIGYYLLHKPQHALASLHGSTQTLTSSRIRAAVKSCARSCCLIPRQQRRWPRSSTPKVWRIIQAINTRWLSQASGPIGYLADAVAATDVRCGSDSADPQSDTDCNGQLIFIAKVKNGFTPDVKKQVFERFRGLETDKCPFDNLPEPRNARRGEALTAEANEELSVVEA